MDRVRTTNWVVGRVLREAIRSIVRSLRIQNARQSMGSIVRDARRRVFRGWVYLLIVGCFVYLSFPFEWLTRVDHVSRSSRACGARSAVICARIRGSVCQKNSLIAFETIFSSFSFFCVFLVLTIGKCRIENEEKENSSKDDWLVISRLRIPFFFMCS